MCRCITCDDVIIKVAEVDSGDVIVVVSVIVVVVVIVVAVVAGGVDFVDVVSVDSVVVVVVQCRVDIINAIGDIVVGYAVVLFC